MDAWNKLIALRGQGGGGDWMQKGEGISQRTHMRNPCTQTTVQCWSEGRGVQDNGEVGIVGDGDIYNSVNNKKINNLVICQ